MHAESLSTDELGTLAQAAPNLSAGIEFVSGVRRKHARSYREGTNVALIDPDLHKLFPTSEAVNRALREYVAKTRTKT